MLIYLTAKFGFMYNLFIHDQLGIERSHMLEVAPYFILTSMLLLLGYWNFYAVKFDASYELAKDQRAHLIKMVTRVQLGGEPNAGIDWDDKVLNSVFVDVTFANHHHEILKGRNPILLYPQKIQELVALYSEENEFAVLRPTPKMLSNSDKKRKIDKAVLF